MIADTDMATYQRIQGYLAWKFNLVDFLPTNHPYKIVAPNENDKYSLDAKQDFPEN